MKSLLSKPTVRLAGICLALAGFHLVAATLYVSPESPDPSSPYADWASAARVIQDAVDAAQPGDEIVVTNGVYASGGRPATTPRLANRVTVDRPVALRSVNGPEFTIIQGYQVPDTTNGEGALRCVYLADGASLSGFTLTQGAVRGGLPDEMGGGGVLCEYGRVVVTNCVLVGNAAGYGGGTFQGTLCNCTLSGNSAWNGGGGAFLATLSHCTLSGNTASWGGGVECGTLYSCTLTGNSALQWGGGAYQAALSNCMLTGNSATSGGGAMDSTLNNCTVTGNSADSGGGGTVSGALTNCIVYFNTASFGEANSYGATLNYCCATPLPPGPGNISADPGFVDAASGDYRLRPDSPCIEAGTNLVSFITSDRDGRPRPVDGDNDGFARFDIGAYEFQGPGPLSRVHFVSGDSARPLPPYGSWATAARTIQEAIDAAAASDEVVVTNGTYASGGRTTGGALTNRVLVDKPLAVRSLNGPEFTIIQGYQVPGTTNGEGAVRCVYLASGAVLDGFTLTNGATQSVGNEARELCGGGVWCDSATAVVSNCVVTGNSAGHGGGGASWGTLRSCRLVGNRASVEGGGAWNCTLDSCSLIGNFSPGAGGGAYFGILNHCTVTGNSAGSGGGVHGGTNYNCVFTDNAASDGGGARWATLHNCTLVGNRAVERGGGVYGGTLRNCIVYANQAPTGTNWYAEAEGWLPIDWEFSCTTPRPAGLGNLEADPRLTDPGNGNLRLQSNSPCVNAGNNAQVSGGADLDGLPRIAGGTVDMGAYEFQAPSSTISYAWLQQYGLPTDGSADTADLDRDGLNTWQEWRCQTVPTDPLSVLRLLSVSLDDTGVMLSWRGIAGVTYFLERSADPGATPAFTPLVRELPGAGGTNTFTDTYDGVLPGAFYRVGVEQ